MATQDKHLNRELEEFILLKDGRRLGYKEYGAKNGFPILALHGTPGSRVWFTENDPISMELDIRLITIDRSGYGLSDEKKNRTIIDFNEDIDHIVHQLELDKFSIFGVSGGGAYALAYASKQNSKIAKVGTVASAYEFEKGKTPRDMCKANRMAFYMAKRLPWLLRFNYKQQRKLLYARPDLYQESIQKHIGHLCISDQEVAKNSETAESMALHFREAFRNSAVEAVQELRLLGDNWGVDFSQITAQVEVWHGEEDTLSPISGMKTFLKRIPNTHSNFIKGKGHFLDEDIDIWKRILESLVP